MGLECLSQYIWLVGTYLLHNGDVACLEHIIMILLRVIWVFKILLYIRTIEIEWSGYPKWKPDQEMCVVW